MRFDWGALLQAGVTLRGLRPSEFWALTPAELMIVLGKGNARASLDRAGLEALASAFPDVAEKE